ncbi:MAG: tyrosine-type recombinase/integrase [Opitutaceae bacterium]|nr:tyrosine-type recombinase/integrase [Opitutaceae bacterium]
MCATRALTPAEQTEMTASLDRARDRLLFLFGLYTGFRIHELLAIRCGDAWNDGRAAKEITLARRQLKGGDGRKARRVRARTVPLHPALQAALQTYMQASFPNGGPPVEKFLFKSRKGANSPITVGHAWRIIKSSARRLGFDHRIATHSMRKTFARAIYDQSGHDIVLTQRALNHRAITTTSQYLESTQADVAAAVLGLGGPLQPLPPKVAPHEQRPTQATA